MLINIKKDTLHAQHKISHKMERTADIQSMFFENKGIKLESTIKISGQFPNILLNNTSVREEMMKKIRKYFKMTIYERKNKIYGLQLTQNLEDNLQL